MTKGNREVGADGRPETAGEESGHACVKMTLNAA